MNSPHELGYRALAAQVILNALKDFRAGLAHGCKRRLNCPGCRRYQSAKTFFFRPDSSIEVFLGILAMDKARLLERLHREQGALGLPIRE